MIRRLRTDDSAVIVQIADCDLRISVAGWMLDQSACGGMTLEEKPRIELEALRQLRELVDLQSVALKDKNMGSQSTTKMEEAHGQKPSTHSATNT